MRVGGAGKTVADSVAVLLQGFEAPVDVTGAGFGGGVFAREVDLVGDLARGAFAVRGAFDALGGDAGPEVALLGVLVAPPFDERGEALRLLVDAPVELGGEVVDPTLAQPGTGVGGHVLKGVGAGFDGAGDAGTPDAERADAEFDVRLFLLDGAVEALDEGVDVVAPPFGDGHASPAGSVGVVGGGVVEDDFATNGVGVEVVVDVDAVDVVAFGDVNHDLDGAVLNRFVRGVEPELAARRHEVLRMGFADVGGSSRDFLIGAGAVGVEPGVNFKAAFVGFPDREVERVVAVGGGAALLAGEPVGPGFDAGVVKGVGGGADLKDDGVHPELLGKVEEGNHFGALLGGGEPGAGGPVDVPDGGDPGGAEFANWLGDVFARGDVGAGLCAEGGARPKQSKGEEFHWGILDGSDRISIVLMPG